MSDNPLDPIKLIVQSEFSKELYDDALSSPAREIGKFGTDFIKTIRLILFPIQLGSAIQTRIEAVFNRIAISIPNEKRIEPSVQVSGQILDKLRFTEEGDELSQMFEELLRKSIDKELVSTAHPAFPHLISQLSRDEAFLIQELSKSNLKIIDTLELDYKNSQFKDRKIETSTVPMEKMFFKENIEIYYTHLHSIGLVDWPITKQDPINKDGRQTGIRRFSQLELTGFGKLFCGRLFA